MIKDAAFAAGYLLGVLIVLSAIGMLGYGIWVAQWKWALMSIPTYLAAHVVYVAVEVFEDEEEGK